MDRSLSVIFLYVVGIFNAQAQYPPNYVSTTVEKINGKAYAVVQMGMTDKRVKLKYFAAKDRKDKTVFERFQAWSRSKSIIAVSSGTYVNDNKKPVGLCFDDGMEVNRTQENDMDALVLFYKRGDVEVTDKDDGRIQVEYASDSSVWLNVNDGFQLQKFISWVKENNITLFQTHLLVHQGRLRIGTNASPALRERRMLALTHDETGKASFYLFNYSDPISLYRNTQNIVSYLKGTFIDYVINLDVGAENVFEVRTMDGDTKAEKEFNGKLPLQKAENLLVFYFE